MDPPNILLFHIENLYLFHKNHWFSHLNDKNKFSDLKIWSQRNSFSPKKKKKKNKKTKKKKRFFIIAYKSNYVFRFAGHHQCTRKLLWPNYPFKCTSHFWISYPIPYKQIRQYLKIVLTSHTTNNKPSMIHFSLKVALNRPISLFIIFKATIWFELQIYIKIKSEIPQ